MAYVKTGKTVTQIVTETILAEMAKGTAPWRKDWTVAGNGRPFNWKSKRAYSGINRWMLPVGQYATAKQIEAAGGTINDGATKYKVTFCRTGESKTKFDAKGRPAKTFSLVYYTVFNVNDCTGITPRREQPLKNHADIEAAEKIATGFTGVTVQHVEQDKAYYTPSTHVVTMPVKGQFKSIEGYYSTLFHELAHATGHKSLLGRFEGSADETFFGSTSYSKEELVAEMTAAILCYECGISNAVIENQAAYLKGWIDRLTKEPNLVTSAAAAAQKAANTILGRTWEDDAELIPDVTEEVAA